ncbi:MAG: phosphoglycolate phosphatase [Cohaesibacter sp.]|nr:phosphoglycolate phosphatase [Cohaesibacter sp.]MCV6601359.1 phosphoglycolate phosphatase [Cohaesibacter sp.]
MSKAIVFDLDGTLIDSVPDLHQASNRLLQDLGAEPVSLQTVRGFVGNGVPKLVERLIKERTLDVKDHAYQEAIQCFLAHYNTALHDKTTLYPGVLDCLTRLQDKGFLLGICTNKPERLSRDIITALGLAPFMDCLIGGDSLAVKKPAIEPLVTAFVQLGVAEDALINDAFYVGDSEVDAATAKAAKIAFFLFTKGYRKSPISALPHTAAFDDYALLDGLIEAD